MQKLSKNKKIAIGVGVLAVIIALMAILYFATRPAAVEGQKTITVQVVTDAGTENVTINTSAEYLGAALEEAKLVVGERGELGLFITEVNGVKADEAKQQWWRVTKGGEQVNTGADETPIADGDTFELTLMTGW